MSEPSATATLRLETVVSFVLGHLTIDFICTMLNRYVFKNENQE